MASDERDGESLVKVRDRIFEFERRVSDRKSTSPSIGARARLADSSSFEKSDAKQPSYISVSCSNNGYNDSLLYSNEFRNGEQTRNSPKFQVNGHANGSALKEKVSLAQVLGTRPDSKYSQLRFSPSKNSQGNCSSFMKNIHSFEKIASNQKTSTTVADKLNSNESSPQKSEKPSVHEWTTMIGQKIEHLMHPDHPTHSSPTVAYANENRSDEDKISTMDNFCDEVINILGPFKGDEELIIPENTVVDGNYFLKMVEIEKIRLLALSALADSELKMDQNVPEDIKGKLRAASGKARLLVSQKIKQFEGLCSHNLNPGNNNELLTKAEDLTGFWEMVLIQVHSIYSTFLDLSELKRNNWKPVKRTTSKTSTPTKKSSRAPSKGTVSEKAATIRKDREDARRNMLEEKRKKKQLMAADTTDDNNILIFTK